MYTEIVWLFSQLRDPSNSLWPKLDPYGFTQFSPETAELLVRWSLSGVTETSFTAWSRGLITSNENNDVIIPSI